MLGKITRMYKTMIRRAYSTCLIIINKVCGGAPIPGMTNASWMLQKSGQAFYSPSSYKPICFLDNVQKLLESMLQGRMFRSSGFIKRRSITDVVEAVVSAAQQSKYAKEF